MGAPVGNNNAAKAKVWTAAINRALAEKSRLDQKEAIDQLAHALIAKALEGDLGALKEFGDRMEGKPAQALTLGGDADNPILQRIERTIVDPQHTHA